MAKINWSRVFLGGFIWVVAFNVVHMSAWFLLLESGWTSAFAALGRPWPQDLGTLALWLLLTFGGGILAIWAYAAVRPQYGPGPKTAAGVAVFLWLVGGVGPNVWFAHLLLLPTGLIVSNLAVEFVDFVVATILGAWLYKEQ
ncbi:MAG: hypothetical protein A3G24_21740 [Betaproteobacteria bacterium RIFCSPLOWO2_12_FULL_62_13]|nr:MAG: hypothetical protein A3G24_21740 [Betaproteobacteria bacterium RIFCSPLOWO2_12_FULL_62_13]